MLLQFYCILQVKLTAYRILENLITLKTVIQLERGGFEYLAKLTSASYKPPPKIASNFFEGTNAYTVNIFQ